MVKDLESKIKLLKLQEALDEFLLDDKGCVKDCIGCEHEQICDTMVNLDEILNEKYLRRINDKEDI